MVELEDDPLPDLRRKASEARKYGARVNLYGPYAPDDKGYKFVVGVFDVPTGFVFAGAMKTDTDPDELSKHLLTFCGLVGCAKFTIDMTSVSKSIDVKLIREYFGKCCATARLIRMLDFEIDESAEHAETDFFRERLKQFSKMLRSLVLDRKDCWSSGLSFLCLELNVPELDGNGRSAHARLFSRRGQDEQNPREDLTTTMLKRLEEERAIKAEQEARAKDSDSFNNNGFTDSDESPDLVLAPQEPPPESPKVPKLCLRLKQAMGPNLSESDGDEDDEDNKGDEEDSEDGRDDDDDDDEEGPSGGQAGPGNGQDHEDQTGKKYGGSGRGQDEGGNGGKDNDGQEGAKSEERGKSVNLKKSPGQQAGKLPTGKGNIEGALQNQTDDGSKKKKKDEPPQHPAGLLAETNMFGIARTHQRAFRGGQGRGSLRSGSNGRNVNGARNGRKSVDGPKAGDPRGSRDGVGQGLGVAFGIPGDIEDDSSESEDDDNSSQASPWSVHQMRIAELEQPNTDSGAPRLGAFGPYTGNEGSSAPTQMLTSFALFGTDSSDDEEPSTASSIAAGMELRERVARKRGAQTKKAENDEPSKNGDETMKPKRKRTKYTNEFKREVVAYVHAHSVSEAVQYYRTTMGIDLPDSSVRCFVMQFRQPAGEGESSRP